MRAAILDPDLSAPAVTVGDWPDPVATAGSVVVRVARAGLNRNDAMWVDERHELPERAVIGSDAVGTVTAVGDQVTGVQVGAEVIVSPALRWGDDETAPGPDFQLLGWPTQGTHAELLSIPAANVHPRPARLSLDQAAALPLAGLTAWRGLTSRGGLVAGETVVVTAASSGVGTMAVQMAAALGGRVVAVTSAGKEETVRQLGADATVLRTSSRFADDLGAAVGPDGADLVLDLAGAQWRQLLATLRRGGRLVSIGRHAAGTAEVDVWDVFWRHLSVLGTSVGSDRDFAALLAHVERASWVPVVDEVLPLADAAAAYARLDAPGRVGKIVLDLT